MIVLRSVTKLLPFVLIGAFLISCAPKTILIKGQSTIDLSKKSIALAHIKVSNQVKPDYQPTTLSIVFPSEPPVWGFHEKSFISEEIYKQEANMYNEYLIGMSFDPQPRKLHWIQVGNYIPMVLRAHCEIPFNVVMDIKPNSVNYLGYIEIIIRNKKNDDEKTVCGRLPLIDQAIAGYSGASVDVVVEDKFDDDMKLFYNEYPGLKDLPITKKVLPQWKLVD